MSRETDVLFAALALQMNFITRDQLVECGELWALNRKKTLPSVIESRGLLKPSERTALKAMVKAHLKRDGNADLGMAALSMDDGTRRIMEGLSPSFASGGNPSGKKADQGVEGKVLADELKAAFSSGLGTIAESPPTLDAEGQVKPEMLRSTGEEKYEFKAELGRGGLGRVVEAVDRDFGREVAVKMMLPGQSPSAAERFLLEGRVAGKLPHPNIVPVYEIGAIAPFRIPMGSYLIIVAHGGNERVKGEGGEGGLKKAGESSQSLYHQPSALHPDAENGIDPPPSTHHPDKESEYAPVRMPVLIGRDENATADVTLYRECEIPSGFVQVPAGKFMYQGDKGNPYSGSKKIKEIADVFIGRYPVTCEEYLEFLNGLAGPVSPDALDTGCRPDVRHGETDEGERRGRSGSPGPADAMASAAPSQGQTDAPDYAQPDSARSDSPVERRQDWKEMLGPAEKRVPRKTPSAGFYWPKDAEGRYRIPTEELMSEAVAANRGDRSPARREQENQDWKKQALKLEMSPIWWDGKWPAFSVSWKDLMAYSGWRTRREGWLFSLPHEIQWEKSARGTDGRPLPWGFSEDASFSNTESSHEGGPRPSPVESFPTDESPYGVRGLVGNARNLCLNDAGEDHYGWRLCRGGTWTFSGLKNRIASRAGIMPPDVDLFNSGRLSWLPCCGLACPTEMK